MFPDKDMIFLPTTVLISLINSKNDVTNKLIGRVGFYYRACHAKNINWRLNSGYVFVSAIFKEFEQILLCLSNRRDRNRNFAFCSVLTQF